VPSRVSPPDPGVDSHDTPARHHARPRTHSRAAARGAIVDAISDMTPDGGQQHRVSPHLSPSTLRKRTGRCPRRPWSVHDARWEGSPRREEHRAAPTETSSSRNERGHPIPLHGPTYTHVCQASSHMVILSSTQHPRCTTSMTHCAHTHWCVRCDSR